MASVYKIRAAATSIIPVYWSDDTEVHRGQVTWARPAPAGEVGWEVGPFTSSVHILKRSPTQPLQVGF